MKKGLPFSPDDVFERRKAIIPPEVFDAFNELIVKYFDGKQALFNEDAAVEKVLQKISNNKYERYKSDVMTVYEQAGWTVEFVPEALGKHAYFVFTKK